MTTDQKKEIRQEVKRRRAEALPETLHENSLKIKKTFVELEAYKNTALLLAYVDAKREVETRLLMEQAWKDGKKVAAPRVDGDGIMHYYYIEGMDDLESGSFGIMEPKKSCPLCKEEEGLMLMPGVAFDEHCIGLAMAVVTMTAIWKSIRDWYILHWHLNFRYSRRCLLKHMIFCRR